MRQEVGPGVSAPKSAEGLRPQSDLGVESRIGEKVQQALIAKGHKLRVSGPWSMSEMAVIVIDPKTGVLHAGADPRNDAYAWAW